MKVKICGITNKDDATWALNYGADFIGVNFWKGSKRHVTPAAAADWVPFLPGFASVVGVFVDAGAKDIAQIAAKLNLKGVQLHGLESPQQVAAIKKELAETEVPPFIVKAVAVRDEGSLTVLEDYKNLVDYFLLDSFSPDMPGGTGETFNWELALRAKTLGKPFFLAGGLTPQNVAEATKKVQPFAVDVASGVEKSPKRKDPEKMRDFITNAKK
ncbi:MAG: phosphoribosylanthranilate isomerase [Elusimicrobia bacterium]|nr:phosphoribosylanthranilate isomerase [Elusimicrobiota bacterium]